MLKKGLTHTDHSGGADPHLFTLDKRANTQTVRTHLWTAAYSYTPAEVWLKQMIHTIFKGALRSFGGSIFLSERKDLHQLIFRFCLNKQLERLFDVMTEQTEQTNWPRMTSINFIMFYFANMWWTLPPFYKQCSETLFSSENSLFIAYGENT